MDIAQMRKLISKGENITLEFKKLTNELNMSIFETIVAFLNKKGGYCILGVSDNRAIEGVND